MANRDLIQEWRREPYVISTDRGRLDLGVIHGFLSTSYWAMGIPIDTVRRSIENSLAFGLYHNRDQVGFARVISDCATFAYVADVFVLEAHRGRGLAQWLMQCIRSHPHLQGLRRWMLLTKDAQGLYAHVGFTPIAHPQRHMEIHDAAAYASAQIASH